MRAEYDERYNMENQCSFIIRVDGDEIEVPVSFGLTANEVRMLYPFILPLATTRIENPTITFSNETKFGKYEDMEQDEYNKKLMTLKAQSKFWYDKPDASLLEIAIRFALDIKLKGVAELASIFETVTPLEHIKTEPISDEEANLIIQNMHPETRIDKEFNPGTERDVAKGSGGSLGFNLYNSDISDEYLCDKLDEIEANTFSENRFEQILKGELSEVDEDKYQLKYKSDELDASEVNEDGLLVMYENNNVDQSDDEVDENTPYVVGNGEDEDYDDYDEDDSVDTIPQEDDEDDEYEDEEAEFDTVAAIQNAEDIGEFSDESDESIDDDVFADDQDDVFASDDEEGDT